MSKAMSPEKLRKRNLKREKEIAKWEKQKARPKKNFYFAYLVFIITLIYATDEIASQIGMLMKTEIANDLFKNFGESSVGALDLLSVLVVPFQIVGLLYRPLADRWGRKAFLVINTFGMSFSMLLIFLSNNIPLYFIGAALVQFFIPHDMHVVYIMESSPKNTRAVTYSVIKFVANMGVMLIPLLRRLLMANASEWRNVFFVPAIVGVITSFIALFTARETDAFIDSRLKYLRMSDAEREAEKKNAATAQGGLIPALKFALKHKQLRWIFITAAFLNLGFVASINYQPVLSYGYAESVFGNFSEAAMNAVSLNEVTSAIFLFPVGSACAQVIMGFISDSKGRKSAAIVTAFDCLVCFIAFWLGARLNWNPYLVGFLCGACIGSFYAVNDVIIMMVGESSPTNLRSSCMSSEFIVVAIGVVISYLIYFPTVAIFGNGAIGTICLCLLVPGFIAGLITLWKKTNETKGVDMDTVTGTEWD